MTKKNITNLAFILAGIAIIAFFGLRAFHAFKKFNGHRPPPPDQIETDVQLIREWMTVPFIARMYYVPEKVIFDALGISPRDNHEKSLEEIDDEFFPESDGLAMQLIQSAILAHQPVPQPDAQLTPAPPLTPVPPETPQG